MRKIGIRYYDDLLTEENFIAMAEGGMTATELCCVREPEKLDFKRVRELGDRYGIHDKTRPDSPVPTLQGPCGRSPKRRGSLRFLPALEMRPSSIAPNTAESREAPPTPQHPSTLRGTLGSSLRSPAEGEGNEGFPSPPEKDLESPSSMRLEALVPSRDSRAMTRSPSPRAWRPDFPGAAREAP